jgi:PBS lyase HEAT-like repeat
MGLVLLAGAAMAQTTKPPVYVNGGNDATGQYLLSNKVAETVSQVRSGASSTARTQAAQHLSELTNGTSPNQISEKSLGDIVSLLDSPDDSVRYWVARCLGNLRSRARSAIPKLQELLAKAQCEPGSEMSADGIRRALSQMGATPPSSDCKPASN